VIRSTAPDVVRLDVRMPKANGLDLLEYLEKQQSSPACILLTTFDEDDAVLRGIRLGARGYLLKDVTLELLTEAIRRVSAGETLFNPALTVRLIRELNPISRRADLNPEETLADRESGDSPLNDWRLFQSRNRGSPGYFRRNGKEPRFKYPLKARRARPHSSSA
jgi:DNA-binding NarL/FixJ family response regulator